MVRDRERRPKTFQGLNNGGGRHFNPFYDPKAKDRQLHERGVEDKIRHNMGERRKALLANHEFEVQSASRAPVTLAPLKWGKPDDQQD